MSSVLRDVRVLAALNGLELFGHERGNIEVFKTLRRSGAELLIAVNSREDGGAVGNELRSEGFQTISLPFNPQWSLQFLRRHPSLALKNPLAVLRCSRRFRKAINAFRPTHIHLGSPIVYSYISLALAFSATPVVYRMGDCPPVNSKFNMAIWRIAMRRATRVVANSEFVRKSAIAGGVPSKKLELVYSIAPVRDAAGSAGLDDAFQAERMVYVGAVAEHKGLLPLVEAFAALARERPEIRLEIVGQSQWDGDFRAQLTQRIETLQLRERITLVGFVSDPAPYYRRAGVHVAPALWEEPFANVVLEAKREGTPSVVFPSGGLPEIVNHKVDGYICREKSTEALIEGLRWILSDENKLMKMRVAARADHEARFDQARYSKQWESIYLSPLSGTT